MKTAAANKQDVNQNESDQYMYYDKLNFIPVEDKDKVWAAKWIYFAKGHSNYFMDPTAAAAITKRMAGEIDIEEHKRMIDPINGKAEFFHADFKACPIDNHLDEIIETTIKQIPVSLAVKAVDEYSISNREAKSRQIQNRSLVRNIINQVNGTLGFPLLKATDDPFKYIKKMQDGIAQANQQAQQQQSGQPVPQPAKKAGGIGAKQMMSTDLMESLVSQIDNSELLGIYMVYLHKEGVEIACELGIDYYLNVKNKFITNHASNILSDIKKYNKACARIFTSQVTGTPIFKYYKPDQIQISPFTKRDLSDHEYWLIEEETNFGDFMREFGAECEAGELEEIFELNRVYYGGTVGYNECTMWQRSNARIMVGYIEFQTQDMEVYADYSIMGNKAHKKMGSDFMPGFKKDKSGRSVKDPNLQNSVRDESHYNVWYKCYYIPFYLYSKQTATTDFTDQAKYIYQFGKLQDQERYGDDERYARSSLFGFYSDRQTWFEIKDRIKKRIDHLWLLFQNDIANIMPHGLNWAYDVIVEMTKTVDSANANGQNAAAAWAQKLKETGSTVTKLLRDKDGNPIGNYQPFQEIKTGHLEAALGKMDAIMVLYNFMVKALGQNQLSEGEAPKPRTNLGSIQIALGTSGKATFFVEEAFSEITSSAGNKILKYLKDIVDYGDSRRLKEFEDMVGQAHMAALQEIRSIPMRNLGLHVEATMTKDQKDMVMQIAQSMASAGTLDEATALFLTFVDNLKQAYAILVFKKAQMDKQLQQAEQAKQSYQMQLLQAQTQLEISKIQAQGQVKMQLQQLIDSFEIKLEQMVINMKGHWTMAGKEQIKQNRIEQDITSSNIEKLNTPDMVPERKDMPVAS